MSSELVAGKRTVVVWRGEESDLPTGHSAMWIGRGRHVLYLSDGDVGGAYRVDRVEQDSRRVTVWLSGDALEGASVDRSQPESSGYPFPVAAER